MTEPKRCIILIPSDGSTYEPMDDPEGQWIFDPDHKIDLRYLTSRRNRAADLCLYCGGKVWKEGVEVCWWHKKHPPPA